MGDNLTAKQKQQLEYLRRICLTWSKFTEVKWHGVHIILRDGDINVVWYQLLWLTDPVSKNKYKHFNQSFKYFPLKDLNKQIKQYKTKVNIAFKERHKPEDQKCGNL